MREIRGRFISIIFQEPMTSLSPLHTVGNQITEALLLHQKLTVIQAEKSACEMLKLVGFPDPNRALITYPFELSGGLRQRAMIAMALICRPSLLIADEPTTALDVTIQAQILKLMNDLQAELDMAILMITHDLGVVANIADDVVVMYRGEIMESGPRNDIFRNPEHPYLKSLMTAVPRFGMERSERLVPIREVTSEMGNLIKHDQATSNQAKQKLQMPLLSISGVTKTYSIRSTGLLSRDQDTIRAVNDVSFKIEAGTCLGLVGESGCGKTTLSKIVMKALSPDKGQLTYNDEDGAVDLLKLKGQELINFRKKIQFIFQDPFSSLNPRMTVFDIISEPLLIHKIGDQSYRNLSLIHI